MTRRLGIILVGTCMAFAGCGDDSGKSGDAGPDATVDAGGGSSSTGGTGAPTGDPDGGKDGGKDAGTNGTTKDAGAKDAGFDAASDEDAGGGGSGTGGIGGEGKCGNGQVDPGEDCDPGKSACCNSKCDGVRGFGAVCRSGSGACDVVEICNGTTSNCPSDVVAPDSTVCRAAAGACDAAEQCDGASKACPSDALQPEFTACGSGTATDCDAADSCNATGQCVDRVDSNATECRASAGDCDVADNCDGTNKACPNDAFQPEFTTCGSGTATDCDAADSCNASGVCVDRVDAIATECRAQSGACDVAEICDGTNKGCPSDDVEPDTTECRVKNGVCDVAEKCDGAGKLCPGDDVEATSTVCRPVSDPQCDVEEKCDGANKACPTDGFTPQLTACGSSDSTDCDAPDTCDTSGHCVDRVDANSIVCRADAGECDVEDKCDGSTKICPADAFEAPLTPCGDSDASDCDAADSCNASGSCIDRVDSNATVCRPAGTIAEDAECDITEMCDGAAKACPGDVHDPLGTPCGDPSNVDCNAPDTCNPQGKCIDRVKAGTFECRAPGTIVEAQCDVADFCDGGYTCPADEVAAEFAPCGDNTATACDAADSCNAIGFCQDRIDPLGFVCDPGSGDLCDPDETCDGIVKTCPMDSFEMNTKECREQNGNCDVAENCTGIAGDPCPTDLFEAATTECRAQNGDCDVAENCDGFGACPADDVEPSSTECRPLAGDCDIADNCDGSTKTCPTDVVMPALENSCCTSGGIGCAADPAIEACVCAADSFCCSVAWDGICQGLVPSCGGFCGSTQCGTASDDCDADDFCDGTNVACPDGVQSAGTTCRTGSLDTCDPDETCDGTLKACPTDFVEPNGTECRQGSGDICNPDETCSGIAGDPCPVDFFEPNSTTCRAGGVCGLPPTTCGGTAASCPAGGACDCCTANGGLGCEDATCGTAVCAGDSFCCSVAWDSLCAGAAVALCGC